MNEMLGSRIKALRSAKISLKSRSLIRLVSADRSMQELRVESIVLLWISFLRLLKF